MNKLNPDTSKHKKIMEILNHMEISDSDISDVTYMTSNERGILIDIVNGEIPGNQYQIGNAIFIMGKINDEVYEQCLINFLYKQKDDRLTFLAISALGNKSTNKVRSTLIEILNNDQSSPQVLQYLLKVLGRICGMNDLNELERYQSKCQDPHLQQWIENTITSIKKISQV